MRLLATNTEFPILFDKSRNGLWKRPCAAYGQTRTSGGPAPRPSSVSEVLARSRRAQVTTEG